MDANRIFGRETAYEHGKLAAVCAEILAGRTAGFDIQLSRAFAWNLLHESRVREFWAEEWFTEYGKPDTPLALRDSLADYLFAFRSRPDQAYSLLEKFANAFVNHFHPDAPQPNHILVTTFDLWSPASRAVWQYGITQGIGILRGFAGLDRTAPKPPANLVNLLVPRDQDLQVPIMAAYFAAQEAYLDEVDRRRASGDSMDTFSPVWVTREKEWRKQTSASAAGWCESVGVCRPEACWMAVIAYPARRAGQLIRPSQLEAGWFGRHFPTPPSCSRETGGRIVDGRPAIALKPDHCSLPEYIHAPIRLKVDDWRRAGFPVLDTVVTAGVHTRLVGDREAHWTALKREFPGLAAWMASANPPA